MDSSNFEDSPLTLTLIKKEQDSSIKLSQNETVHLKEYTYRYWICFFYGMSNMTLNIIYITCSPITKDLKSIYDLSEIVISSSALFYLILYLPANFPSNYILDKYGIRVGVTLGTVLTLIGSWIRIFVNDSFYYVLLGSFIGAIGQPLVFNTPGKIAAYWFKPENRVKATTFLGVISPISLGIGFLIPGLMVVDITTSTIDEYKQSVYNLFFYQSLILTILCIPGIFLFKEKPLTPPSYSSEVEKSSFPDAVRKCSKNKNFIFLLAFFASTYGALNAFSIVINILVYPFGYTSFDTSLIGAILIIFGLIGSFVVSLYVAKTNLYKFSLVICSIGYAASIMMIGFAAYSENVYIAFIPVLFLGFFGFPILPIAIEMGCEVTFPVGEAFSTGLLVSSSQILATVATVLLELVIQNQTKTTSAISFGVFFFIIVAGLGFLTFMNEEFKRTEFEKKNKIRKRERMSGSFVSLIQSIIQEKKEGAKSEYDSNIGRSSPSVKDEKEETDKS